MPKFSANLTFLFQEVEFLARFEAAKRAGFAGVEFAFPYSFDPADVRDRLDALGLTPVVMNFPPGDWSAGDRGLACLPARREEFRQSVNVALDYARAIGCSQLHCMAGLTPSGEDAEIINETYLDNLRYAANKLQEKGVRLLIEPINTRDMPGYYLHHTCEAVSIINKIGKEKIALQFDVYHMQIMEGNLSSTIAEHLPLIDHIQIADTPGRHEPGAGEINFDFLLRHLDEVGYKGWIGLEYFPSHDTSSSLSWLKKYKNRR